MRLRFQDQSCSLSRAGWARTPGVGVSLSFGVLGVESRSALSLSYIPRRARPFVFLFFYFETVSLSCPG